MPLSSNESRCISALCKTLQDLRGGSWRVCAGPTLDDLYPNSPSPEVLVSDGKTVAAVEVTRLTGGSVWNRHLMSWESLKRQLQPSIPGHYVLVPGEDCRLPLTPHKIWTLKGPIEKAAQDIWERSTDRAIVYVPCAAELVLANRNLPGEIICCHDSLWEVLEVAQRGVIGAYTLVDLKLGEHSFLSREGCLRAAEQIADACRRAFNGGTVWAHWEEEWELLLADQDGTGVEVLCSTEGLEVSATVHEDVRRAVRAKRHKFAAGGGLNFMFWYWIARSVRPQSGTLRKH